MGSGPSSVRFGYRWDDAGNVVIAYPICPGDKVAGARISVDWKHGKKGGFKTIWSARNPASKEVEMGVFSVGTSSSFHTEKIPLRKGLPNGFYVSADQETLAGDPDSSRGDWIDQAVRPSSPLKPDEYMTSGGKVVSRKWVNDQLSCNS